MTKRNYAVIAIAGQDSHGKTTLLKSLAAASLADFAEFTCEASDQEPHFATIYLPGGTAAVIIDMPGQFASSQNTIIPFTDVGIAMLVVAADQGFNTQTLEQIYILQSLDVHIGLVVLNKCDLLDNESLSLRKAEINQALKGTFLESAPLLEVSSFTQRGFNELKYLLSRFIDALPASHQLGKFGLLIDKISGVKGFNAIVTGIIRGGTLNTGDKVMLYPPEIECKVRSIQVHFQQVGCAYPGQRASIDLAGVQLKEVQPGFHIASPNSLISSTILHASIRILPECEIHLNTDCLIRTYLAGKECLAHLTLLGCRRLDPGGFAFAQLRLLEAAAIKKNDRFIIRSSTQLKYIGVGIIIDAVPLKHLLRKKGLCSAIDNNTHKCEGGLEKLKLLNNISLESGIANVSGNFTVKKTDKYIEPPPDVFSKFDMEQLTADLVEFLENWHKNNPHSLGISSEELKDSILQKITSCTADDLLSAWHDSMIIKMDDNIVSLLSFEPQPDPNLQILIDRLDKLYLEFSFNPLPTNDISIVNSEQLNKHDRCKAFNSLIKQKRLVSLSDEYYMHRIYYLRSWEQFRKLSEDRYNVALTDYQNLLQCSREVAIALLESFDMGGLTEKKGTGRTIK